jgi:hypothetical protein
MYALDRVWDGVYESRVDDAKCAERTLVGVGESKTTGFGAVLTVARRACSTVSTRLSYHQYS